MIFPRCIVEESIVFDIWKAQVAVGVVSCVLASGIVFGFAALKSVLVDEQVYRELCTKEELRESVRVCYMQDLRYCHRTLPTSTLCSLGL